MPRSAVESRSHVDRRGTCTRITDPRPDRFGGPDYPAGMKRHRAAALPLLTLLLTLLLGSTALAQVATLATPNPEAEASEGPASPIDDEQAILDLVACLRDNGLDVPDPQFGPEGPTFVDPSTVQSIDFTSDAFIEAMEACEDFLAAVQPEVDPEQQAEQVEQQLVLAECMRREGIDDFPDPDPVAGFSFRDMAVIDPFDRDFQTAFTVCAAEMGFDPTAAGPAGS